MIHILITSHGGMAQGMVQSVKMLVGEQENLDYVTFDEEMGQDELDELYADKIKDVSEDNQYLILCDIKGGSPFNVVSRYSFKNDDVAVIDVYVNLKYGAKIPIVSENIQKSVKNAVQNMTGIVVAKVNIFVVGITFDEAAAQ